MKYLLFSIIVTASWFGLAELGATLGLVPWPIEIIDIALKLGEKLDYLNATLSVFWVTEILLFTFLVCLISELIIRNIPKNLECNRLIIGVIATIFLSLFLWALLPKYVPLWVSIPVNFGSIPILLLLAQRLCNRITSYSNGR